MCGFAGSFQPGGEARRLNHDLMEHRGPDAMGEWTSSDGTCWLGHVRLAILELSEAGGQPMASQSGRTMLVFNGEIYNHLEVRRSLRPVAWRGHSDTETLVEAWEQEGARCLQKLRGMFAFAVYDSKTARLDLVRDCLGIKPLYFRREGRGVSFASEVRVLGGGRRPILSDDALCSYLATGHLPGSGEIGEGLEILPPGCRLQIQADAGTIPERWWPHHSQRQEARLSTGEAREQTRSLLVNATAEHLLADVPVGVFLSGGTDSSIIALLTSRAAGQPVRTFTVGFPHDGLDERPIARLVAEKVGSQHVEVEVTPGECIPWVEAGVAAMDLPTADAINTYIVSRAVRNQGFKVALSGLGGDELFGGYPSFRDVPRMALLGMMPRGMAALMVRGLPRRMRTKLEGARQFDPFTLALLRRRWWSPEQLAASGVSGEVAWPALPSKPRDAFAAVSWAEILGYTEPMLLRDSDQMSMAVSLELRVPFFDHRLVEFALGLPERLKRGLPPKRLLIEAFAEDLPNEVWDRPRQGFVLPMDDWMRGALRDFTREGLAAVKQRLERRWVDGVEAQFHERKLHWTRLWQLVVLGHYMQRG